jgi:hypothetical protein
MVFLSANEIQLGESVYYGLRLPVMCNVIAVAGLSVVFPKV